MKIEATLFDATGSNEDRKIEDISLERIEEKQLLWVRVTGRDRAQMEKVCKVLALKDVPVESILNVKERPKVDIFEKFYRFFIVSVRLDEDDCEQSVPVDFLVGKNYIISIADDEVGYFKEFLEREKGERQIGELDAESFVAALLDLHIVTYFRVLEDIDEKVDKLDDDILKTDMEDEEFLRKIVKLRTRVSKLRRWFLPHRDVYYALSRADFQRISESDSAEQFATLNTHFENAVDAIESSRDTVLSLFDLYATKAAQKMNVIIQRLTFLTLIFGCMGVVAGVFGMNYETEIFKSAGGFWITVVAMSAAAIVITIFARFKRWV